MGNQGGAKNDDFSKNPNFNMDQHRQQMQAYNSNYNEPDLNMPITSNNRPNISASQYKQITRTCSIYKPSFNIHQKNQYLDLEFDYDSDQGTILDVHMEVENIQEDPNTQITIKIDSKLFFQEQLPAGKKQKFKKQYPIQGLAKGQISNIIIRVKSKFTSEVTEYSLRNTKSSGAIWKVLLQKFELNNHVTQLQNIYKTDENNECIVCLCERSEILIEPCNHLCICNSCIEALKKSTNQCPICRHAIASYKVILRKDNN